MRRSLRGAATEQWLPPPPLLLGPLRLRSIPTSRHGRSMPPTGRCVAVVFKAGMACQHTPTAHPLARPSAAMPVPQRTTRHAACSCAPASRHALSQRPSRTPAQWPQSLGLARRLLALGGAALCSCWCYLVHATRHCAAGACTHRLWAVWCRLAQHKLTRRTTVLVGAPGQALPPSSGLLSGGVQQQG